MPSVGRSVRLPLSNSGIFCSWTVALLLLRFITIPHPSRHFSTRYFSCLLQPNYSFLFHLHLLTLLDTGLCPGRGMCQAGRSWGGQGELGSSLRVKTSSAGLRPRGASISLKQLFFCSKGGPAITGLGTTMLRFCPTTRDTATLLVVDIGTGGV